MRALAISIVCVLSLNQAVEGLPDQGKGGKEKSNKDCSTRRRKQLSP